MNQRGDSVTGSIRVFIALDLPPQAKEALTRTIGALGQEISTVVRCVDSSGIHLTLKFLGNIHPTFTPQVFEAMTQAAQSDHSNTFQLSLSQLGVFPNPRRPRVLWAGIQGDLTALAGLQIRVEEAAGRIGFAPEQRPYRPHLTLGRVREGVSPPVCLQIGQVVSEAKLEPSSPWLVDSLHLIRSDRRPEGATYTSLGSIPLGASSGAIDGQLRTWIA